MVSNRIEIRRDWRGVAAFLLVQLAGFALYAKTLTYGPVWDDHFFLADPFVRQCGNLWKALDPRSLYHVLPVVNSARPAWLASVIADACLSQDRFVGYRLTSIFWHSCGAASLICLAWMLSEDSAAAVAAGALFLVHPVHTEAVNIVSFRSELMALTFVLFALCFYLAARTRDRSLRAASLAASFFCGAVALLSKETAVTLPILVCLVDHVFPPQDRRKRSRLAAYAGYGVLVALYLLFRMPRSGYVMEGYEDLFSSLRQSSPELVAAVSQGPGTPRPEPRVMEPPPFSQDIYARPKVRLLTMSRVFGSYARLLVWPWPLQGDYAPRPVYSWHDGGVWVAWAAWLALFAAAWRLRRPNPLAALGLLWTGATLLPVSGLIALKNLQAERYLYASSAGACLAAGSLWAAWWRAKRRDARPLAGAALAAAVIVFAVLTEQRNLAYVSDAAFFQATVEADPAVPRARFNLAQEYRYEGRPQAAEREFKAGLSIDPRSMNGRLRYARFLLEARRGDEALAQLRAAAGDHPASDVVRRELSRAAQLSSPRIKPAP